MKILFNIILFPILVFLIQIPTLGEVLWRSETKNSVNYLNHFLVTFGTFFILLIVLMFIYHSLSGDVIDFGHWSLKNVCIAVVGAFVSQGIQYVLSSIAHQSTTDPATYTALHSNIWSITVIALLLISPILEEILFQGILQNGILKNTSPIIAIILTAFIFAIIHGFGFNMGTIALFVSGLAYALVFYYTNDLKMAILCHGISNSIVMALLLVH